MDRGNSSGKYSYDYTARVRKSSGNGYKIIFQAKIGANTVRLNLELIDMKIVIIKRARVVLKTRKINPIMGLNLSQR